MNTKSGVVELWSVTGRSMVISGNRKQIREIVERLNLPTDSAVSVARNSYVVGLWGHHLESYLRRYHQEDVLVTVGQLEQSIV